MFQACSLELRTSVVLSLVLAGKQVRVAFRVALGKCGKRCLVISYFTGLWALRAGYLRKVGLVIVAAWSHQSVFIFYCVSSQDSKLRCSVVRVFTRRERNQTHDHLLPYCNSFRSRLVTSPKLVCSVEQRLRVFALVEYLGEGRLEDHPNHDNHNHLSECTTITADREQQSLCFQPEWRVTACAKVRWASMCKASAVTPSATTCERNGCELPERKNLFERICALWFRV